MFCPVLLNCAQITSQARTLGQPGLISFPLWTVLRSFENENNPIKLRSLVIELAFFPMYYIRTLPRVSFHLCFYSLIRGGKKIICRGGQSHYLLFTDVEVKAQKDEVHLFQVIQQSKWQTENRTKSFSAHSVASRCLPVLMKTSEM